MLRQVRVEAAPLRQDYSREDEVPHPFPLAALGRSLAAGGQGFHPCAGLSVRTGRGASGIMPFPSFLLHSRNYYDPGWSLKWTRRLKNAVVRCRWFAMRFSNRTSCNC